MNIQIDSSWKDILKAEFDKEYFRNLVSFVKAEYRSTTCYPPGKSIFESFNLCPFDKVKVVIIGQDPYINEGQAHGLCFSVKSGTSYPPSLKNIFKELSQDIGSTPSSGDLTSWAEQGVLMLNATLTVRKGESNSHSGKGWETFTDAVIHQINAHKNSIVYMLWGSYAQKKAKSVDSKNNRILKSVHPSPLSAYRGFFGCGHFSKTNEYLIEVGQEPINW